MISKFTTALLALCLSTVSAVHPLKRQGSDFIDTVSNQRFQVIGIAYQPGGSAGYKPESKVDPLSDPVACRRDAVLMQSLGVNTVRVYNLDPLVSHDECASIFNSAGIYMIIDVNSPLPNESINNGEPWTSYDSAYLKRVFQIVENFKGYPNLLGFFAANELVNDENSGKIDPPYIRAVTRDIKNYIAKHSQRPIPVGYSAADVRDILVDSFNYIQCGLKGDDSDPSKTDFFGINSYSWCGGDATFQSSGYSDLVADFSSTTIPVFFSEYGCREVRPRVFDEVQAVYSDQMRNVMSGGVVYEWTEEENDFGLVKINSNKTVSLLRDFDTLQGQFNKLDIKAIQATDPKATSQKAPTCSSSLIKSSSFNSNFTIPAVAPGVQDMINNGVTGGVVGKLVSVTNTDIGVAVYGSNGAEIKGLQLKILSNDASNTPSGTQTSGTSGTSNGSSSSSSAATVLEVKAGFLVTIAASLWLI